MIIVEYFKNSELYEFDSEDQAVSCLGNNNYRLLTQSEMLELTTPKPSQFYVWDEGNLKWIDPRTDEELLQEEMKALPPLSAKDFRHMLDRAGLRTQIETMIEDITDQVIKSTIKTEYEYAQFFERTNPVVMYMVGLLGMSDEQVNTEWKTPIALTLIIPEPVPKQSTEL